MPLPDHPFFLMDLGDGKLLINNGDSRRWRAVEVLEDVLARVPEHLVGGGEGARLSPEA